MQRKPQNRKYLENYVIHPIFSTFFIYRWQTEAQRGKRLLGQDNRPEQFSFSAVSCLWFGSKDLPSQDSLILRTWCENGTLMLMVEEGGKRFTLSSEKMHPWWTESMCSKSTPQCQAQRCPSKLSRSSVTDKRISYCPMRTWVPDAVGLGLSFFLLIQANHQVVQALNWLPIYWGGENKSSLS